MVLIERVIYPYTVTIPVSEEKSKDADWYNGLKIWLSANIEKYMIEHTDGWIVAINVLTEQDALLIKVAWESDEPLPDHKTLKERRWATYENISEGRNSY